jgi:ubiquitin C-terminal hydrolase
MNEAEDLDDYKCEGCKKAGNVYKRMMIGQTPNVLFVHL